MLLKGLWICFLFCEACGMDSTWLNIPARTRNKSRTDRWSSFRAVWKVYVWPQQQWSPEKEIRRSRIIKNSMTDKARTKKGTAAVCNYTHMQRLRKDEPMARSLWWVPQKSVSKATLFQSSPHHVFLVSSQRCSKQKKQTQFKNITKKTWYPLVAAATLG